MSNPVKVQLLPTTVDDCLNPVADVEGRERRRRWVLQVEADDVLSKEQVRRRKWKRNRDTVDQLFNTRIKVLIVDMLL